MHEAKLKGAVLNGTCLAGAKMTGALLWGVKVEGASFRHACLEKTSWLNVKMREAAFDGAVFPQARIRHCDLEGMELRGMDFFSVNFTGSYLTASDFSGSDLGGVNLRHTGLAEVKWENVDLRGADFTKASFHLGSSRSGLVGSVIASEGTRTGFYTDDYCDQEFKAPEEIRKANLCGCDLREAFVTGADFYLVDLRGARYSAEQGAHFAELRSDFAGAGATVMVLRTLPRVAADGGLFEEKHGWDAHATIACRVSGGGGRRGVSCGRGRCWVRRGGGCRRGGRRRLF